MLIIPVLDLLNGTVVRGVAGRRSEYRPIVSRIAATPEPLAVALAFRSEFGLNTLYVADLDAIEHDRPNLAVYASLEAAGFTLLLDAGLRSVAAAAGTLPTGLAAGSSRSLIAGLESCPGPAMLTALLEQIPATRLLFSLDLHGGKPWRAGSGWPANDPFAIAEQAVAAGVQRMIVLDLAQVGVSGGPGASSLCSQIRSRFPDLELITGGGVRDASDLERLQADGIDGVLVASALHDGRLTRADLERF